MNTRDQRICLGLVPVFGALFLIGFMIFPGFFPPLSHAGSASAIPRRSPQSHRAGMSAAPPNVGHGRA